MAARPVKVSFIADTADLKSSLSKAEASMNDAANTARTAGQKIESSFDTAGEAADGMATTSAQVAGGLGDVAGALEATGFISEGTAQKMELASAAIMGVTGVSDLANAAFEKLKLGAIAHKAATVAQTVATTALTGAQTALNAVMALNPIALLVIALVLLVAAIVIAYQKSETFRNIVNGAFGAIKDFVMPAVDAIKTAITTAWDIIKSATQGAWSAIKDFVTNPISTIKSVATEAADTIKTKIGSAWDSVKTKTSEVYNGIKTTITEKFNEIVTFIKGVPERLLNLAGDFKEAGTGLMNAIINGIKNAAGFIGSIGDSIWGAVKSLINQAITKINAALEFTIDIPGPKDVHINAPNIPALAKGGIVNRPTLALIGEAGPEAVVPLNGKYGMGRTTVINVTLNVPATANPVETGRELQRVLDIYNSNGGRRVA